MISETLLVFAGTVTVPATTKGFVAQKRFCVTRPLKGGGVEARIKNMLFRRARVQIWDLGGCFEELFLGKIEKSMSESVLKYYDFCLRHQAYAEVNDSVITELGGETRAETTLAQVYSLMERQSHGENGVLVVNGRGNVFFVKDVTGLLQMVRVYWCGSWNVSVFLKSTTRPRSWVCDSRVFANIL